MRIQRASSQRKITKTILKDKIKRRIILFKREKDDINKNKETK